MQLSNSNEVEPEKCMQLFNSNEAECKKCMQFSYKEQNRIEQERIEQNKNKHTQKARAREKNLIKNTK